MKKYLIGFFLVLFVLSGINYANDKSFNMYLGANIITDSSLTFEYYLWGPGVAFDFYITDNLMISPEVYMYVYKFEFDPFILAPAVIGNIKLNTFFVGAGITKWFLIGSDVGDVSSDFALKLNAGFITDSFKLSFFAITSFEEMFSDMALGASFALKF